jgi:hypothetical protein
MATQREKAKRKLRYTDAKEVADKQGQGYEIASISLPKGVQTFTFREEKVYKLNVIPFVTKAGNPMAEEDMVHYERTYWVHRNVGPEGKSFACLQKTFKKPCPVCQHAAKLEQEGGADKETLDALRPKKRQLWQVQDINAKEKGFQILECSYFNGLGELIDAKLDATEDDDPYRRFFHLDGGMMLKIKASQDSFNGRSYFKPTNVEFSPRDKALPESVLDEGTCLDDLPREMPYKELQKAFYQEAPAADDDDDDDEDDTPKKPAAKKGKGKPAPKDDDEDEEETEKEKTAKELGLAVGDIVIYDDNECEIKKISGDGTSLTLEDADGETYRAVGPEDVTKKEDEEEGDDDEAPPPKKGKGKPAAKKSKDEDDEPEEDDDEDDEDDDEPLEEDDEDDEEDDDEAPPPKKGKKAAARK